MDQTTNHLVIFFKQAISSPPDVEEFVAGFRTLSELPKEINGHPLTPEDKERASGFQFWAGGRAGTNFFIGKIAASNSPPVLQELISGRSGSTNYQFNRNSVSYMTGTNAMGRFNGVLFMLTRQFLNMGLADINPQTVVWNDNEFSARDDNGAPRYGYLEVLANVPRILRIHDQKNSAPLKTIEYTYPTPASSGGGFPSKMVLTARSQDGLKPVAEVVLHHVRISPSPLEGEFFSDAKFKGTNITRAMIYSNDAAFASDRNGKMIQLPKSFSPPRTLNPRSRIVINVLIVIAGVAPLIIFGWLWKRKK